MSLVLMIKAESDEGLTDPDEIVELANWYFNTGMYRSSGAPGRFMASVYSAVESGELVSSVELDFSA